MTTGTVTVALADRAGNRTTLTTPITVAAGGGAVPTNVTVINVDNGGALSVAWVPAAGADAHLVQIDPAPTGTAWNYPQYRWVSGLGSDGLGHAQFNGPAQGFAQHRTGFCDGTKTYRCRVQGWKAGAPIATGGPNNDGWSSWSPMVRPSYYENGQNSPPQPMWLPNGTNIGVPPGTVLTPQVGDLVVTTANAIYNNLDILGAVTVRAPGVTFNSCRLQTYGRNSASSWGSVYVDTTTAPTAHASFSHCELDGGGANGTAGAPGGVAQPFYGVFWGSYTLDHCSVHGYGHPCQVGGDNVTLTDSMLWDTSWMRSTDHLDALQATSGSNLSFTRVYFENLANGSACLNLQSAQGLIANALVDSCWFDGGNYGLSLRDSGHGFGTVKVVNGRFFRQANASALGSNTAAPHGTGIFLWGGGAGGGPMDIQVTTTADSGGCRWDGPEGGLCYNSSHTVELP